MSEHTTSEEDPRAASAVTHKVRYKTNGPNSTIEKTEREKERERESRNLTYVCVGKSCPI